MDRAGDRDQPRGGALADDGDVRPGGDVTAACEPAAGTSWPVLLLTPGTVFNGRYRIDEALGTGGSGVVYRAWTFPFRVETIPWYFTALGFCSVNCRPYWTFSHPGRLNAVAASRPRDGGEGRYGVLGGNNELLHLVAFAILPARDPTPAWAPPRMVDPSEFRNHLFSYTLLPLLPRLRLDVARGLLRAGRRDGAPPILDPVLADHPPPAVAAAAHHLLAVGTRRMDR